MDKLKYIRPISLQILSVIIAFFLWLYVLSSADTKVEKIVHVHFVLPEQYSISNMPQKKIKYYLNGPRAFVRSFSHSNDHIKLNVKRQFSPSKKSYEFSVNDVGIKFPFGVNVENIEPKVIKVDIEQKLTRKLPVKLQTVGNIPSDHKMMQWTLYPDKVEVSGPKSIVQGLKEIKSMSASLSGITESGKKVLNLITIDERVKFAQDNVEYQYEVQPTRANMIIKDIPIRFLSTKVLLGSNRRFVNLMVLAESGKNINLKKEKIKVIAEIPDNAKGKVNIELRANLPDGLHLLEIMPKSIEVDLKN